MELDPAMHAVFNALDHHEGIVKRNQTYIDDAAKQIAECQERKRKAEENIGKLKAHLDDNFPNWEEMWPEFLAVRPRND